MVNVQQAELDDARNGIVYFLGNIDVTKTPGFDIGLISNFASGTSIVSDLKNVAGDLVRDTERGGKIIGGVHNVIDPIKQHLTEFFDKMTAHFYALYGEAGAALEWLGEFGTWAVSSLVGSLADIIPGWGYVKSASALYDGVRQSVVHAIQWLKQVFSGWGVKLLDGSPATMTRAIAQHNAGALAGGLKDIAIATGGIVLQAAGDAAAGAGAIVNAVVGILQRIANLVGYCLQRFFLNRTFSQAQYHWKTKAELVTNHDHFNEWFRRSCVVTPVVAALCMQSGYAANPLRFLALINNDDEIISQDDYEKGVKHIETLKNLSKNYIQEYTTAYKLQFLSGDAVIQSRLEQMAR